MAFRTRRRRQRVVWLPNIGSPAYSAGQTSIGDSPSAIDSVVTVTIGGGRIPTLEFPLFQDNPPDLTTQTGNAGNAAAFAREEINDMVEWGYRLRRIVGKLHIQVATPAGASAPTFETCGLRVTAGIIVRRVDPTTGLAVATAGQSNPSCIDTVRDPWIWRRAWTLSNAQLDHAQLTFPRALDTEAAILACPSSTTGYGSVLDGPHVDAKTARVVGPEERVFLDVAIRQAFADDGVPTDWDICTYFDYRGLATLRANQGNRRNASR